VRAALALADRAAVLVEGRERIVAPTAELRADARMAELYLGRRARRVPAEPATAQEGA
jgi:branched-chain amino acid transport system ATP-binding protein